MCEWGNTITLVPPDPELMPNRTLNHWVKVDSCIAEAVQMLWAFGYATTSSCCGHGKGHGEIVVAGQLKRSWQ